MSDKKRKTKKHFTVLPYFTNPIVFVLISLIAVVPMCFVMLGVSVNYVHKAQNTFHSTVADYSAFDGDFTPSNQKDGTVNISEPVGFSKIGELTCKSAGLNTSVYYGNNRVNYRNGAGLSTDNALPGTGGGVVISANAAGAFKSLYNVKTGDVITLTTSWGIYKYKVSDIGLNLDTTKNKKETLYLTTAPDKTAFAALSGDKYVVIAVLVSGPVGEVQNEQ